MYSGRFASTSNVHLLTPCASKPAERSCDTAAVVLLEKSIGISKLFETRLEISNSLDLAAESGRAD